jgi:predicted enzyme related to lactoylglutathione lyase
MEYQSLSPNMGVKSVNETVKFYTEVLGFQLLMSVPETGEFAWAMVGSGNAVILFQEIGNLQEEYPQLNGKSQHATITFYLKLKGMNALYEKLKDTDYLVKALHKTFYGADEFAVYDNNGFILTITEDAKNEEQIKNYDNYFLPADDYEKSKRFYFQTLGLSVKFEFKEQGMIAFKVGNEEPAIILKDKKKFPDAKPTVWIEVDNVKVLHDELKNKNIQFLTEPFQIHTGWAVEFIDPSGNRLGFTDYING